VRAPARAGVAAALLGGALALAGCGSGEREFDAETVISELNEAGAGLALGQALPAGTEGTEVTVISFDGDSEPSDEDHGGSGAVVILDDAEIAQTEFRRCETAVTFLCFRAANAVLRFDDISAPEREQVTGALRRLEGLEDS
jgi:hypothetical protein